MSIIQGQYVYTLQTEYVRRRRNPKRDSRISYFTREKTTKEIAVFGALQYRKNDAFDFRKNFSV